MMKNQVRRIAALLAFPLFSGAAVAATDDAHLIEPGPGANGGSSVAYSTCEDPEEECISAEFGCSASEGWLSLYDGQVAATRLLESDAPTMTFHVGSDTFENRVWDFDSGLNELNGGWVVTIKSDEMAPVFAAILKQPEAPITVDVAGQPAFDLTPADADRPTLSKLAQTCSK